MPFNNTDSLLDYAKKLVDNNNDIAENEKRFYRFLNWKARIKRVPVYGSFELTPFCNLDCKMCYIHLSEDQFSQRSLLSLETWFSLINQAHKSGLIKVSLTGGECLTYPGFDDIFVYLRSLGIMTSILTNGLLLNEKRIDLFKKNTLHRLQISLYGSSNDAYDKVTGHRVFDIVIKNIISARDAGLPLVLCITPSAFMFSDLFPLLSLAESLHIPYYINSRLKPPREETGRKEEDLSVEQYIELFKIQRDLRNECFVETDYSSLPDENKTDNKVYGLRCAAGRSAFVISYNGDMFPCHSLYKSDINVVKLGFVEAWERIKLMAENYMIPAECPGCVYRDVCLTCPAMHTHAPSIGHCDPNICERTKKLIRAGIIPMPNQNGVGHN